jgi:hypothetical protein
MPTHAASENAPANVLTTTVGVLNLRTRYPFEKLARLPSVSPRRALRNPPDAPGKRAPRPRLERYLRPVLMTAPSAASSKSPMITATMKSRLFIVARR